MNTVFSINRFFDFYFLEAMRANITMAKSANPELNFSHSVEKLERDVNETFNQYVEIIEKRVRYYIWAAALGEARHAHDMCDYAIEEINGQNTSRNSVYDEAIDYPMTEENIQAVHDVFEADNWHKSSFGGDNWQNIVDALEYTGATFIDHVIDLEHNGGSVFNKPARHCKVKFDGSNLGVVTRFFDFKRDYDILSRVFLAYGEKAEVTFKVYRLIERYSNIIARTNVDLTITETQLINEEIEWGDSDLTMTEAHNAKCENCGDYVDEDDMYFSPDGDTLCPECWNDKYFHCDKCGEVIHDDDKVSLSSGDYCEDCAQSKGYEKCTECGEWTDNYTTTEDTYEIYCEDCVESECGHCEEHGTYSDIEWHFKNEHDNYCQECGELVDDLEEHNLEEHYTPALLTQDADGIFDNPVEFLDCQILKSFKLGDDSYTQYIDPNQQGKGLFVIANPVVKNKWSIVIESAGLYIGKGTKEDMLDKMARIQEVVNWKEVTSKDVWNRFPYETKVKITSIMGYNGFC